MTTPGDFAALYDALAEVHDRLVERADAFREETLPLRGYLRALEFDDAGDSLRLGIQAVKLESSIEEMDRIAQTLDGILQSVFALALLDHNDAMHSDHPAP